jgi:hypothetical protein
MSVRRGVLAALAVVALIAAGSSLAAAVNRPLKPTITGFSPKRGVFGTKVTITGTHFGGATVLFNGNQAASVAVNRAGTRITATVPVPEDEDAVVTGPIAVLTHGGATQTVASFRLVQQQSGPYVFPRPRITGFSPSHGKPGTKVTVAGAGFGGATAVTFDGVSAKAYTVPSDARIAATVPARAKTGKITITTAGGTASSAASFAIP